MALQTFFWCREADSMFRTECFNQRHQFSELSLVHDAGASTKSNESSVIKVGDDLKLAETSREHALPILRSKLLAMPNNLATHISKHGPHARILSRAASLRTNLHLQPMPSHHPRLCISP